MTQFSNLWVYKFLQRLDRIDECTRKGFYNGLSLALSLYQDPTRIFSGTGSDADIESKSEASSDQESKSDMGSAAHHGAADVLASLQRKYTALLQNFLTEFDKDPWSASNAGTFRDGIMLIDHDDPDAFSNELTMIGDRNKFAVTLRQLEIAKSFDLTCTPKDQEGDVDEEVVMIVISGRPCASVQRVDMDSRVCEGPEIKSFEVELSRADWESHQ
jgi:hypothetical protein